jgi:hypothetical protein
MFFIVLLEFALSFEVLRRFLIPVLYFIGHYIIREIKTAVLFEECLKAHPYVVGTTRRPYHASAHGGLRRTSPAFDNQSQAFGKARQGFKDIDD